MAGGHYVRPPSLRAFLEAGGALSRFVLLDSLVEAIVVARRLLPAEVNRKQAARNRRFVERWFARHGGEEPVPATQELLTFAFWKAECLEDPSLAELFESALPPETLARALQLVADLRHVHPLAVHEDLVNWTCRACGESFERAPAAVVTNTGAELGYDNDLSYCLGCISIATAALETASGIDRFTESIDDKRHQLRPSPELEAADELVLADFDTAEVDADADADTDADVDVDVDDLVLVDEATVRTEAARLSAQLEAAQRRVAALGARRAALIRRLESSRRRWAGEDS